MLRASMEEGDSLIPSCLLPDFFSRERPSITSKKDEAQPLLVFTDLTVKNKDRMRIESIYESKYRYVVSCQVLSAMRKSKDPKDVDKFKSVEYLVRKNPSLRIAFVDKDGNGVNYSVLWAWDTRKGGLGEEFRLALPGPIMVGEGKPNNQNHVSRRPRLERG